jgi:hypothetical protein
VQEDTRKRGAQQVYCLGDLVKLLISFVR